MDELMDGQTSSTAFILAFDLLFCSVDAVAEEG